jgi:hypothetical protein
MITIITATKFDYLNDYRTKHSHYDMLWLPELNAHPQLEAEKIMSFITNNDNSPHREIYTLRDTSVNVVGHMISQEWLNPKDISVIVLPDNQIATFDDDGFLVNWPYGFYNWDIVGLR